MIELIVLELEIHSDSVDTAGDAGSHLLLKKDWISSGQTGAGQALEGS